ncbi:lysozyme inhibitor LprI family protein [Vibrio vulnificus]|uniref:lysozyme inhibitor LprI family protein n=1 Tax=Vibrio vulnificus TaxID=672 RepID=UPI00405A0D9E
MKKSLIIVLASLAFDALAGEKAIDCDAAFTTVQINQCAAIELDAAKAELEKYLKASFEHNSFDSELVEAMKLAQTDWQTYMSSHCDSVYTQWRDGTIRGVMAISCKTKLTKQRTHELWENFLTYMDSTPPVLPEPSLQ